MTTTGTTARELQNMIMDKLRAVYPECDEIIETVNVTPASGPRGKWVAETVLQPGALEPEDCHRARAAITHDLQRQFHLVSAT